MQKAMELAATLLFWYLVVRFVVFVFRIKIVRWMFYVLAALWILGVMFGTPIPQ